jgi:threonine dehydrogenase-like Zn-dependent dehydrogenase
MRGTRVIVAGACMERDQVEPIFGINKELGIQFVLAYTPDEFSSTLRNIAEGKIDVGPLVTGQVGVAEVPGAFEELASPERHAKIVVEPWR